MRVRSIVSLILLVVLSAAVTSCGNLFDTYLENDEDPPGGNAPGGEQASSGDPTPASILPDLIGSGNAGGPLKPICFLNTGVAAATIMPWTYVPLNAGSAAMPSSTSTVAFPGGNSSACLSLPLGTYTWCYHWELGDVNGDGMSEYAHVANMQRITLDESDPDDMDLAERVTISPAAGTGEEPGMCDLNSRIVLDIRPFITDSRDVDSYYFGYSTAALAHLGDYVTLRGPITVVYFFHHCDAAPCTTPVINEPPVQVSIQAGETQQFYLDEGSGDHPGNWDMYIQLISIDG